jgi:photosystem II stability/assembly factor-like uncharacterized protein
VGKDSRVVVVIACLCFSVVIASGCSTASPAAQKPTSISRSPEQIAPAGVSFVNPDAGYLLGDYSCEGSPVGTSTCLAMAVTRDGGRRWTLMKPPPVSLFWGLVEGSHSVPTSVSQIEFANVEDGYLFGPGLEVTRDAGRTWSKVKLGAVEQLVTGGGHAYAVTTTGAASNPQLMWRSPLGSATWSRVSLPAGAASYQVVASQGELLLLQNPGASPSYGRTKAQFIWVSTNAGWSWRPLGVPCVHRVDGTAAALAIAYAAPTHWAVDCAVDDQSSMALNVTHQLFVSYDAGRRWLAAGRAPPQGVDDALAWNGADDVVLATDSGASDALDVTTDGGARWHTAVRDGGDFYGWGNLGFVTRSTAFVVGPTHYGYDGNPDNLYRSQDGGKSWLVLPMPRRVTP